MGILGALWVPQMPGAYCSAQRADQIQSALLPKVRAANRGELAFQQTLESIRNCAALKSAKAAEISVAVKQAAVD
jgi:hypothetical protein